MLTFFLLVGLGAAVGVGLLLVQRSNARVLLSTISLEEAESVAHSVQSSLARIMLETSLLATHLDILLASGRAVDRASFERFSGLLSSGVEFQFLPRVNASARAAYEAATAAMYPELHRGFNGGAYNGSEYPILALSGGGTTVSPDKPFYFPIQMAVPMQATVLNLDTLSNWDAEVMLDGVALPRMSQAQIVEAQFASPRRPPVIFGPFRLAQETVPNALGLIIQVPLNNSAALITAVVRVYELVRSAVPHLAVGLTVHVVVNDASFGVFTGSSPLHGSFGAWPGSSPLFVLPPPAPAEIKQILASASSEVAFAGSLLDTNWTIIVLSSEQGDVGSLVYASAIAIPLAVLVAALCFLGWVRTDAALEASRASRKVSEANAAARAERRINEWLSHEVRNPLSVAISANNFCRAEIESSGGNARATQRETVLADLDLVGSSLQYILSLLNNMLDASHFDGTGRLNIIATPISLLEDVLEAVKAMLSLHSAPFVVTVDTEGDPLWVIGDAMRLKQVVMNLAKNATKFVGNGFVRIAARRTADGSGVIIRVEDSGPGMPRELSRRDLFKRTYETRDSMRQGTGIGLYICAFIAEAMGGSIELDETYDSGVPGRPGACFQVTLPLPPPPAPPLQREQNAHTNTSTATATGTQSKARDIESQPEFKEELLGQGLAQPGGAERILVVDHDATFRQSLFRELKKLLPREDICSAATGEAALALVAARRGAFSIIIINLNLDGGPGALKAAELVSLLRDRTAAVIVAASESAINSATYTAATGSPAPLPGADIVAPRAGLLTQQGCAEMLCDATARPLLRRVLIVDDLPSNRLILRRLLLKVMPWCQIDEAESGEAALETITQHNRGYDCIMIDEFLGPGMLGSELAARLASDPACHALRVSVSATSPNQREQDTRFQLVWSKPLPPVAAMLAQLREASRKPIFL